MDDDQNLILDRPLGGKSNEQLRKHTLDSTFENKPIERALYLLTKGDDIQKLSIIQALPQLVRIDQQATFSRIVPKIQQELPKASSEFQVTTSQIFKVLIEKQLPVNLLGAVIQGVDSRDPVVSTAWMDTLLSVIPLLSESVIKNEILPLIIVKSQLNQPVIQRVAACRIIGKIANNPNLRPTDIKKDVLPFVQVFCQDCTVDVRAVMCMQLPYVAEAVGANIVKTQLLPCFVELASDNNPLLREAAVLTMVNLFPFIDSETIESTMVPLIKKFCEKIIPEDNVAAIIANQIGAILEYILPSLSNDDKVWFLTYYKVLAHRGFEPRHVGMHNVDVSKDVVCRENCASNLPAMAKFVTSALPQQIDVLYSIFRDLAGDPCYIVRRAVARCIHEMAKILGANNRMLKADYVRLLRDDTEDVLQMLVPNLSTTLLLLTQYGFLSKDRTDQGTMEVGRAVTKCQIELSKGYNWRLLVQFLEQLECLPKCIPCDFIHQHFTPIVLGNAVNGRVKPVRYQATKTLLVFLRHNSKENQQKWLRDALINQFCYSDSCYTRQIYVKLCLNAIEIFSSKYFKEYFFIPLISLVEDSVSNVRYTFIGALPRLKLLTLVPPADTKYKVLLQDAIYKLEQKEKEPYIVEYLKRIMKEYYNTNLLSNKDFMIEDHFKQEQENVTTQQLSSKAVTITANQSPKPKATGLPKLTRQSMTNNKIPKPVPLPDMNFLEQHFYIDAGVSLPDALNGEDSSDKGNNLSRRTAPNAAENISDLSIDALETCNKSLLSNATIETFTLNMTDDVKVNLRKSNKSRSCKLAAPRTLSCSSIAHCSSDMADTFARNKRHSSFLSASCLDDRNRKLQNRRSLNINAREFSRIPILARKRHMSRNAIDEILNAKAPELGNCDDNLSSVSETFSSVLAEVNDDNYANDVENVNQEAKTSNVSEKSLTDRVRCQFVASGIENRGILENVVKSTISKNSNLPIAVRRPPK